MRENITFEKAKKFAMRIWKLREYLEIEKKEYHVADQIFRSGTSIGANIAESVYAASGADFINKLQIAIKEASETEYWLDLLKEKGLMREEEYKSMIADCKEMLKILTSSLNSNKKKINELTKNVKC